MREAQTPASSTPQEPPTRGRGGRKDAVQRYEDALRSGNDEERERARDDIYASSPSGKRGADAIEAAQTRVKAEERANTKANLHVVKPEE